MRKKPTTTIKRPKQKTHLILKTLYQRVVFRSSDFMSFSCMYENVLINFISDRMEYEGQNVIDRHVMYMYIYLYGGRFEESNDASTSHQILYIVYFVYL